MKRLEELGVGRPSTYASIIKTIQDREYVWKKGTALVPSFKAFAVVNLLEQHFPDLVDYAFTARMEDDLDDIAGGDEELVPWLSEFYFGPADGNGQRAGGLKEKVSTRLDDIDAAAVNAIPIGLDPDGVLIVAKPGRDNSPYLLRGEDTGQHPRPRWRPTSSRSRRPSSCWPRPRAAACSATTRPPACRSTPRAAASGPTCSSATTTTTATSSPSMASLFKTMTLEQITLDDALELLSLPRVVGVDPADGVEITAQNGKFGPYLQKLTPDGKKDSRSLDDRGAAAHRQPRRRLGDLRPAQDAARPGGQAAAARARRRPGQRQADGAQGRPVRALRHRRRDQRVAAQGRRRRDHHRRAGLGAAAGPP